MSTKSNDIQEQITLFTQGTAQILPEGELVKKLSLGRPLKIKFGADPSAADLHLGHAVVLSKMRQFQEAGHHIIFLIGDITARVGDPSGKSKTRPILTPEEIAKNAKTYFEQVGRILDLSKTEIRYNSEWLLKLNFGDVLELCSKTTLARIIEREDFSTRLKNNGAIGLHELLYPMMQGYDSVALDADIEFGGTDQTFNLLMGRYLQEQYGKPAQVIITMPLLEGLDGIQKMSKSLGNYIGIGEAASVAYGKLMSMSDNLMWRYFELLLYKTKAEIQVMQEGIVTEAVHPMDIKKMMALAIVSRFWSKDEALQAQKQFEALFQHKDYSAAVEVDVCSSLKNPCWIVDLLKAVGGVTTSSEAKRLIDAGAVQLDEKSITDFKAEVVLKPGMIVKVGKKRIYKIG